MTNLCRSPGNSKGLTYFLPLFNLLGQVFFPGHATKPGQTLGPSYSRHSSAQSFSWPLSHEQEKLCQVTPHNQSFMSFPGEVTRSGKTPGPKHATRYPLLSSPVCSGAGAWMCGSWAARWGPGAPGPAAPSPGPSSTRPAGASYSWCRCRPRSLADWTAARTSHLVVGGKGAEREVYFLHSFIRSILSIKKVLTDPCRVYDCRKAFYRCFWVYQQKLKLISTHLSIMPLSSEHIAAKWENSAEFKSVSHNRRGDEKQTDWKMALFPVSRVVKQECPLTCEVLTLGVDPVVAPPTLHHLAVVVVVVIALIAKGAEVTWKTQVVGS